MRTSSIQGITIVVFAILMIPLIAMQFTNEVNWSLFDFIVMGSLLFGAGIASDFVFRNVVQTKYRIGLIALILFVLLLIWAELAVGIVGSPFAGS